MPLMKRQTGFAQIVSVTINGYSVVVEDNGRGIPVGIHEKLHVSGVEVVYTQLHAGGKFNNDSYGFSGGLHGVGASVVNALSEYVEVEVATGGKLYSIKFHSYEDSDGQHAFRNSCCSACRGRKNAAAGHKGNIFAGQTCF